MNCRHAQRLLFDDRCRSGEPGQDPDALRAHLAACPDCRRYANGLETIRSGAKSLADLSPRADLARRAVVNWRASEGQRRTAGEERSRRPGRLVFGLPLAGASAVAALVWGVGLWQREHREVTPQGVVALRSQTNRVVPQPRRARKPLSPAAAQRHFATKRGGAVARRSQPKPTSPLSRIPRRRSQGTAAAKSRRNADKRRRLSSQPDPAGRPCLCERGFVRLPCPVDPAARGRDAGAGRPAAALRTGRRPLCSCAVAASG
jgi:hypothetical protein